MKRDDLLVWADLEMTGLDARKDLITEIATIITDSDLNIIAEGPEIVIHVPNFEELTKGEEFFEDYPFAEEIKKSTITLEEAEKETLSFIEEFVVPQSSPLCGNSIYADRIFLRYHMSTLNDYLHYRNLDVSTVKELARRWKPEMMEQVDLIKKGNHRAKDDILESIEELKFYRDNFFRV